MNNWWIMQRISENHRQEVLDEAERRRLTKDCRKPRFSPLRSLASNLVALGIAVTAVTVCAIGRRNRLNSCRARTNEASPFG